MTTSTAKPCLPKYVLCQTCGLDEAEILLRVKQMDLTSVDGANLKLVMQQVIKQQVDNILDDFYDFLMQQGFLRQYVDSTYPIERLKRTQKEYLLNFGLDFDSCCYFEYRLRVGIAHARIELPLHIYLAAYTKMQSLLFQAITLSSLTEQQQAQCQNSVSKIILLDISLAIEAYNHSKLLNLTSSVEQLQQETSRLSNKLMHDTLTGALSRGHILDALSKLVSQFQRSQYHPFTIAMFDLDHFKKINDNYGHQIGDTILHEFSQSILSMIRHHDLFGRYGGEEFLLLIVDTDASQAYKLVERIREQVANTEYVISDHHIKLTVSIGLTEANKTDTVSGLIERADKALYDAKAAGRNKTIVLD